MKIISAFVLILGAAALFLLSHFILELAARAFKLARSWVAVWSALTLAALSWGAYMYWHGARGLSGVADGQPAGMKLRPPVCEEIFDASGAVVDYLCPLSKTLSGKAVRGLRLWRPLGKISPELRDYVVFLEDAKFYQHPGIDLNEISNAIQHDVENRRLSRGASTITQQLAKNLFLSKEKSFFRKATEVPLTLRLEKELNKTQILELYLNTIEWGPALFGAEAAARAYFGHGADALSNSEAILLALMIPNPVELNPWAQPTPLKARKAAAALEKRAGQFRKRLARERRLSPREASDAFREFHAFLRNWSSAERPAPIASISRVDALREAALRLRSGKMVSATQSAVQKPWSRFASPQPAFFSAFSVFQEATGRVAALLNPSGKIIAWSFVGPGFTLDETVDRWVLAHAGPGVRAEILPVSKMRIELLLP